MKSTARMIAAAALGVAAMLGAVATARADGYKSHRSVVAEYNWSGIYFGGTVGGAWGASHIDFSPSGFPAERADPGVGGWIGGGHIGVQRQFSWFVIGAEASVFGGTLEGKAANLGTPGTMHVDPESIVMINGRLGYAGGHWLLYATAGYANADLDAGFTGTTTTFTNNKRHDGWNVGGGIEWLVYPWLMFGVEYRHIEFEHDVHLFTDAIVGNRNFQTDASLDVVIARLSYLFGAP